MGANRGWTVRVVEHGRVSDARSGASRGNTVGRPNYAVGHVRPRPRPGAADGSGRGVDGGRRAAGPVGVVAGGGRIGPRGVGLCARAAARRRMSRWWRWRGWTAPARAPAARRPCKHVLALLLLWTDDGIGVRAEPEFVTAGSTSGRRPTIVRPARANGTARARRRSWPIPTPRPSGRRSAGNGSASDWPSWTAGSATRSGRGWQTCRGPATRTSTRSPPGWSTPRRPGVATHSPRHPD